jgi:acyl-CoA thioester hydrolase
VSVFEWPVRVYWEDTDAGGVVYHTSYIRYFERGRTEWLRHLGVSQARLADESRLLFTVVDLRTEFIRPARLDDLLTIRTRVLELGAATVTFGQEILRTEADEMLVQGQVRVACLDAASFKPRRLPASLREELT